MRFDVAPRGERSHDEVEHFGVLEHGQAGFHVHAAIAHDFGETQHFRGDVAGHFQFELLLFRPGGGGDELRQHFLKLLFDVSVGYRIHCCLFYFPSARPVEVSARYWLRNVRPVFRVRPPHMHPVRVIKATTAASCYRRHGRRRRGWADTHAAFCAHLNPLHEAFWSRNCSRLTRFLA
ncbi:protein of unknown function [Paraburkholderia dioscoreae]|uniref:Uncharacterized protein n=1 Tax=Paraburkholderia dioscoreae TaxID=2604047 RepID=A0A5Q4ZGN7_9BURK|nr:protein of unknown function [Paraburkholderia dioscoreae]